VSGRVSWNPKAELANRAATIAKEKHPEGFNKKQLIDASKEVYGGHATNPHKSISSKEDIDHKRNAMANIDGHYPLSMSDCYVVGINGGCGWECPVFVEGTCDEPGECTKAEYEAASDKEKEILDLYFSPDDLLS